MTDTMSVRTCLTAMSERLVDAAAIARAAVTCADAGPEREVVRIVMEFDELLHEVTTLHAAMLLFGRMARQEQNAAANA